MRDVALLPKAHLHVHPESTIRWATLREIGERNGVSVPGRGGAFAGFRQFAEHNELVRSCLRRPEDFARIAAEFCADEAADGTRYAEVTFTDQHVGKLLDFIAKKSFLALDEILGAIVNSHFSRKAPVIIILDCCRSNIESGALENYSHKFSKGGPSNIFIMHATAQGDSALDGKIGDNGAFTSKLLLYLDTDHDIETVSKKIITDLEKEYKGIQVITLFMK